MFACFPVEVDPTLDANPFALGFANQVNWQIQQEIITDWLTKIDIPIFRDDFLIKFFLGAILEHVQFFEIR